MMKGEHPAQSVILIMKRSNRSNLGLNPVFKREGGKKMLRYVLASRVDNASVNSIKSRWVYDQLCLLTALH